MGHKIGAASNFKWEEVMSRGQSKTLSGGWRRFSNVESKIEPPIRHWEENTVMTGHAPYFTRPLHLRMQLHPRPERFFLALLAPHASLWIPS